MWGWQCDSQTDKQATDRQATSVLAISHQNRAVENVREAQLYWQSGDRRTDRQATNRQATSVLATGDLEINWI